jgi:hypothetical protein
MARARMAATLFVCLTLTFTAACSGEDPIIATDAPVAGSETTAAAADPTPATSPLDGMSAQEVWKKVKADTDDAESVHVAASLIEDKQRIVINLKISNSGKAFGTLTFDGDKITVRRLGKTLYFKADRGFWTSKADAATAKALTDKWIMVKKGFSADMEQFFQLTEMDFIVGDVLTLTAAEQKALTRVPGIKIAGQQTVGLSDKVATKAEEFETLYVADADPALPLNFPAGDTDQSMKFRGWNEDFTVLAPKGAIDLAKTS